MKSIIIILILILIVSLVTLPTLAAGFSPLDDPVDRYNFDFKEGKYKISLGQARNYRSQRLEDLDIDMDPMFNYHLALEYNIQKGVKIRLNKNWIPEYSYNIINLANISAIQEGDTRSLNNWGLDCTYKANPTAHEINFSYQSSILTQKFDENDTRKDTSDRFTLSYTPDITLGGFGIQAEYESSEDIFYSEQGNSDIYHLTVSYEGQI